MAELRELQPGQVFAGDYRIVRRLAEGGMGAVYEATQLSTSSQRALKLMRPDLVRDPDMRRRFQQEAQVGARIRSDHVVQVLAAGIDAATDAPFLVMELLEGAPLSDVMRRGPLPPAEVGEIVAQLCHALAAAHRAGVVHRDLKPENLFLAPAQRAGAAFTLKVLDFGIAKVVAESKTRLTVPIGTPLWMAPEQTAPGPSIGPGTDLWALGLLVFHMLTGRHFWRSAEGEPNPVALLREVAIDPVPAASRRAAELGCADRLPPGFDGWFARCVSRDPGARFQDAAEAHAAIAPLLGGASLPPRSSMPALGNLPTAFPASFQPPPGAPSYAPPLGASWPPDGGLRAPGRRQTGATAAGVAGIVGCVGVLLAAAFAAGAAVFLLRRAPTPATGAEDDPPPAVTPSPPQQRQAGEVPDDEPAEAPGEVERPRPGQQKQPVAPAPTGTIPTPTPTPAVTPTATGGAREFDRGAATAALGAAAAGAKSCKRPEGPTGTGKVRVVYAPSGNVTAASVQGPPFAGTPVGSCVAGVFRGARVPPFDGSPVTVTKSFSIN